ncbi:MAG: peptidase M23 [Gammaproteobacteria bacterium]|nr:peptidase M23 [Gammaproteobacteria bacterium]
MPSREFEAAGPAVMATEAAVRRRWLVAGATLPLIAAAVSLVLMRAPATDAPAPVDLTAIAATETAAAPEGLDDGPDSVEVTVQRDDTLDQIFRSVGIDLGTLAELRSRPEVRKALDVLRPGDSITLTHANGVLQSLNRQISDTLTLSVSRAGDGYAVNYIENPLETEVVGHRARIESSLFEAGQKAGMSSRTIMTLANQIFGFDIDFALDIREGDEFGVLYEQKFQDGHYVSDGRVLAAEFTNQGKTHRAVWFESKDGEVQGYFTPDGKGMRKAFLRAPLDFTRVSSGFNLRRLHPILGIVRAHKGTDYAAPTGTPIWAAGSGRVVFAGRKGGYGNVVVIDHGKGVQTVYGHMSRFANSLRVGRGVGQGDTIGYVGMTGAATGPHLHYEYRVNDVPKNPATIPMPRTEIPSKYLPEFRSQAEVALAKLELTSGADRGERLASR